ncbi:MAG: hypothetical protein HWD92_00205 [Flavobacteriia bacterium]|nr:hypothetical protein [Flavobacteriia bacterium]
MIVKAFKNNWFIGVIIIGSILGGIIGFLGSELHERKRDNEKAVELVHYFHPEWTHIHGITDTIYQDEYMKFTLDTSLSTIVSYPSRGIPTSGRLYLLDVTQDSVLGLIARENDHPTMADPRYQELWVWMKHVKEK